MARDMGARLLLVTPLLAQRDEAAARHRAGDRAAQALRRTRADPEHPVVAAHAVAPRPSYMQDWRDDLQWLADQCVDANVIMAGDFNATVDHMAGLGVGGRTLGLCDDAAIATGNGAIGTWSAEMPSVLGAPIDHVMTSTHWEATGSLVLRSTDGSGSDHRPLIVQLEPVH